ncbi:MAG: phosphopantetheine-binding protein [Defluviitaleaceae bacterium]|nr:phosphopantetheine-binding protein [Defluviitaleaceae bacterium]
MLDKLQKIFRVYTDNKEVNITGDMVLLTDLGLNSYELVELICEIEEQLNIVIPDRIIGEFKTVQNVVDYISVYKY